MHPVFQRIDHGNLPEFGRWCYEQSTGCQSQIYQCERASVGNFGAFSTLGSVNPLGRLNALLLTRLWIVTDVNLPHRCSCACWTGLSDAYIVFLLFLIVSHTWLFDYTSLNITYRNPKTIMLSTRLLSAVVMWIMMLRLTNSQGNTTLSVSKHLHLAVDLQEVHQLLQRCIRTWHRYSCTPLSFNAPDGGVPLGKSS